MTSVDYTNSGVINPRHTCTRVTVVVLCLPNGARWSSRHADPTLASCACNPGFEKEIQNSGCTAKVILSHTSGNKISLQSLTPYQKQKVTRLKQLCDKVVIDTVTTLSCSQLVTMWTGQPCHTWSTTLLQGTVESHPRRIAIRCIGTRYQGISKTCP